MKKTVILGDMQVIYEGTPEEIATLESLSQEEQKNFHVNVYVNGEEKKLERVLTEFEKEIRKAALADSHPVRCEK